MSFDVPRGYGSGMVTKRGLPRLRGLAGVIWFRPVSLGFVGTRASKTLAPPCACLVAVALCAAPVRAQAPASAAPEVTQADDRDDPNVRFTRAETMYREGRYEEAIELLEGLIADYPEPILYFNLGRAHESSGRIEDAIAAYGNYLQADPDAQDRDSVLDRIARLQQRLPEPEPTSEPQLSLPPPVAPPPRPIVAPWVVAGLGGAGLVIGGTFAGLSRARSNDARDAPDQITAAGEHDTARRHAVAANIGFGVGGALLVAGVIWGITAVVKRRRASQARVASRSKLRRGL